MAYCFRWKIILPPGKRLGIDASEHTLFERDAERVWLGALTFKEYPDERELLVETTEIVLRGSGYATEDEATATAHRWRTVLDSPSPDGISRPTSETEHQGIASFLRQASA